MSRERKYFMNTLRIFLTAAAVISNAAEFELPLTITFNPRSNAINTPVCLDADFDQLTQGKLTPDLIDPHSLKVLRKKNDGSIEILSVQFEENLYYSNKGRIFWEVRNRQLKSEYTLKFDRRKPDGALRELPYMPVIGVGEELYAQQQKYNPVSVPGMHPFPILEDFDGDGKVDLISSSHYSNSINMPWAGIFFWKNTNTNEKPSFAPPLRLRAEGVDVWDLYNFADKRDYHFAPRLDFISEYYVRCDLFDWFGSGRKDLITLSRHGGIRVYRNTGKLRADGTPELVLALKIPLPASLAPGFPGMKVIDYDGSKRGSIIVMVSAVDQAVEYGQLIIMHNVSKSPDKPEFILRTPVMSHLYNPSATTFTISDTEKDWQKILNFSGGRSWCVDFADIDNDGENELLNVRNNGGDRAVIEVWKLLGSREKPLLEHAGVLSLPIDKNIFGFEFRIVRNKHFDGCLVGDRNTIRYYPRKKSNMLLPDAFGEMRLLEAESVRVKPAGYTRPWPIPGKNGCIDLLLGDEAGFISIARNTGTPEKPCFAYPQEMTDKNGNVLHLCREALISDFNLERGCGQLKPTVADWDNDGKTEIIVSGNTNKILLLDDVDFASGTVGSISEIKPRSGDKPFAWRKGVLARDIDNDGVCELLALNNEQEFCWYKQDGSPTMVREWKKLRFEDGKVITSNDIPPVRYRNPVVVFDLIDWDEKGIADLYISSNHNIARLEGADKSMTVFKRPTLVTTADGVIRLGLHENQVTFADINNDGIAEMLVGAESGYIHVFCRDYVRSILNTARVERE